MRKADIPGELSVLAFNFFYWFSRFEFALKENGYLKSTVPGERAEPGWDAFVAKWAAGYVASGDVNVLLEAPPARQVIGLGGELTWKAVGLEDCTSDLARVARLLKTVRNNLFHGGKHGGEAWDDVERTRKLLVASLSVLDHLATLSGIEADYTQYY